MKTVFIELHTIDSKEAWYINLANISAIRHNHDKDDPGDNGIWIYLTGDQIPVKVKETMDEIAELMAKTVTFD